MIRAFFIAWLPRVFKKTVHFLRRHQTKEAFQSIIDDMTARPYMRKCRRRVIRLYKRELREV